MFKKTDTQSVQFFKMPFPFKESRNNITLDDFETPPIFFHDTRHNNYPAHFAEFIDPKDNHHGFIFLFGNEEFTIYVIGRIKIDQPKEREEILRIMNSVLIEP